MSRGSDDIKRCPECLHPERQGHSWRCSKATLEERVVGAEREIEGYWRGQLDRWKAHAARSHAAIGGWQLKYMQVKHENNMLRRKLYQRARRTTEEKRSDAEAS